MLPLRTRARRKLSRYAFDFVHEWRSTDLGGLPLDPSRNVNHGNVELRMGRHSYATGIQLFGWSGQVVTVGKFCAIGDRVSIIAGGNHPPTRAGISPVISRLGGLPEEKNHGTVTIGNDVYIGNNATILTGVDVADGAVIGAGALVTKSVGPYEIVVGVPARSHGTRFPADVWQQVRALRWWDWPDELIAERARLFDDPEALVAAST